MVALAVGYSITAALTSIFSQLVGKPPLAWLRHNVRIRADAAPQPPCSVMRLSVKIVIRRVNVEVVRCLTMSEQYTERLLHAKAERQPRLLGKGRSST